MNLRQLILLTLTLAIVTELSLRLFLAKKFLGNMFDDPDLFPDNVIVTRNPLRYHETLGWVSGPADKPREHFDSSIVQLGNHWFRSNGHGQRAPASLSPKEDWILAIGDSYPYGDTVTDEKSWPAVLERILNRKVVNGAVCGYGLDQMYIRAKELIPELRPTKLVLGLLPESLYKTEYDELSSAAKPYFTLNGNELVLRNVPVPKPKTKPQELGKLRKALGNSHLAHQILSRFAPGFWYEGLVHSVHRVHENGAQVSCELLKNFQRLANQYGTKVLVLLEYTDLNGEEERQKLLNLAQCAPNLDSLDLWEPLKTLKEKDPIRYYNAFNGHLTSVGNVWVAEQVAKLSFSSDPFIR